MVAYIYDISHFMGIVFVVDIIVYTTRFMLESGNAISDILQNICMMYD